MLDLKVFFLYGSLHHFSSKVYISVSGFEIQTVFIQQFQSCLVIRFVLLYGSLCHSDPVCSNEMYDF